MACEHLKETIILFHVFACQTQSSRHVERSNRVKEAAEQSLSGWSSATTPGCGSSSKDGCWQLWSSLVTAWLSSPQRDGTSEPQPTGLSCRLRWPILASGRSLPPCLALFHSRWNLCSRERENCLCSWVFLRGRLSGNLCPLRYVTLMTKTRVALLLSAAWGVATTMSASSVLFHVVLRRDVSILLQPPSFRTKLLLFWMSVISGCWSQRDLPRRSQNRETKRHDGCPAELQPQTAAQSGVQGAGNCVSEDDRNRVDGVPR